MSHLPLYTRRLLKLPIKLFPTLESKLGGYDSPNPGEWDVGGISVDGLRELGGPVHVIGDV